MSAKYFGKTFSGFCIYYVDKLITERRLWDIGYFIFIKRRTLFTERKVLEEEEEEEADETVRRAIFF